MFLFYKTKSEMLKIKKDGNFFVYSTIVTLFSLFLLIYFPTLSVLHINWSKFDENYAHGYMVLLVTIYLLFISRKKIFMLSQSSSTQYLSTNLALILFCSILWFLAFSIQVQVIQIFTVILMIWLWIAVVFGRISSIHALIPIGLLFMALPLWEGIVPYLQAMTVFITEAGLSLFGRTIFIDGNFIHLASGVLEVSEDCSGFKYFLVGTSLAIIYSEMNLVGIQRKIVVVLLGVIISIIANWIRVFSLALIADISKMQSSLVYDHDNFGWVVFMLCFIMFFIIANTIKPGLKSDGELNQTQLSKSATVRLVDNYYFRAFSATLVASMLPVISWSLAEVAGADLLSHQFQFETAKKINKPYWLPNYTGFDESNTWRFIVNAREVDITILSYKAQKQGKELIYYSNTLNDSKYALTNMDDLEVSNGLSINRSILSNRSSKILVGWYYKIGDFESNDSRVAKLLQIPSIWQGVSVASLVTISTECISDDCRAESQLLSRKIIEGVVDSIVVSKRIENES